MSLLDTVAHFTQKLNPNPKPNDKIAGTEEYFVETDSGDYMFSDPEFGGSNTLTPARTSYARWAQGHKVRDMGRHTIRNFCGNGVRVR